MSAMRRCVSGGVPMRNRAAGGASRRSALYTLAAGLLAVVAGMMAGPAGGEIPNALIFGLAPLGKLVPEFDLPPVEGRRLGLSDKDLKGKVSLVNVFASWCTACREEHPLLMELAARGVVPIYGLNLRDRPDSAQRWLDRFGDPYTRTGADRDGRVANGFGLLGVPQTFVVDQSGRIAFVQIGVLDRKALDQKVLPLIETLRAAGPPQGRGEGR